MHKTLIRGIILFCILFSAHSTANSVQLFWSIPTQNVDNTPIPLSGTGSITSTIVEWGTCSSSLFGTKLGQQSITGAATQTTISTLSAATTYCFRVYVINTYGSRSEYSNIISTFVPAPTLSTTVNVIWSYRKSGSKTYLNVVGSAPVGIACYGSAINVNNTQYHALADTSQVTLTKRVHKNSILVSICK